MLNTMETSKIIFSGQKMVKRTKSPKFLFQLTTSRTIVDECHRNRAQSIHLNESFIMVPYFRRYLVWFFHRKPDTIFGED